MISEEHMAQYKRESKKNIGKRVIARYLLAELRKHRIRRKARNTPNAYGSDTNTEWRCLLEEFRRKASFFFQQTLCWEIAPTLITDT